MHCLQWGDPGAQDLLLVHGNGAHAHWFLPTGALLSDRFHCTAMTFSGMGNSGWRDYYDRDTMVGDIVGVTEQLGLQNPVLAAHSFGGMIALPAAATLGDKLGALIILDFVVQPEDRVQEWFENRPPSRPTRVYPDKKTCVERFRLLPEQPCANRYLLDFIAEHSVRPVAGGWTWKFDPTIYDNMRLGTGHQGWLQSLKVPHAFIYGENTVEFEDSELAAMAELMQPDTLLLAIPQAQHHLMLDQPLAFAQVLSRVADQLLTDSG